MTPRNVCAFGLGLLLALAVTRTCHAQAAVRDSQYTADTAAIVRGLYPLRPGRGEGRVVLAITTTLVAGAIDRDAGGYRDTWATRDKREHALAGAVLALTTDDRTIAWRGVGVACLLAGVFEVGQMRPSRFPAAGRNTLGYGSWRDVGASCAGAAGAVGLRAAWRALR